MYKIREMTVDMLENAVGIDNPAPRFCWKMESGKRDFMQSAYQVRVWDGMDGRLLWDAGKVESDASSFILYKGVELQSRQLCEWEVRIWDAQETCSGWSGRASFEMGLLHTKDWKAKWIEPIQRVVQAEPAFDMQNQLETHEETSSYGRLNPCLYCRKGFMLGKKVKRARAYVTAHGIYELWINGKKAGDLELAPGFTTYRDFLQYQTYDITNLLQSGENVVGVILADGWYAGRIGMIGDSAQFGDKLGVLLQVEVDYEDGSHDVIGSDASFVSSTRDILYSDLYIGEKQDLRLRDDKWCMSGFQAEGWKPVELVEYGYENLAAQAGEPIRVVDELEAVRVIRTPKGETVIDFGQVVAGRIRLEAEGLAGTAITLEHGEVLDKDGNFLNNIIGRNKDQKDVFLLRGEGKETLEPRFTFHGFRYVKVTGYPGNLQKEAAKAVVLSSDMKKTGEFTCSDERVNRLQKNIFHSQQGNMISIPTDCPQRERAGWTGDIQIFAPTACYNMGMYLFLRRWLRNARAEQYENGGIPNIIPFIPSYNSFGNGEQMAASAGWGDAITIVPWVLYQKYGDEEVLRENYQAMKKWVEYIRDCIKRECEAECGAGEYNVRGCDTNATEVECGAETTSENPEAAKRRKYLWKKGQNLGDWLIPSVVADASVENMLKCSYLTQECISTCFYAYSASILSKAAKVLGEDKDEACYFELAGKVRKAFSDEYVKEDGNLGDYQGVYVIALQFDMIAPEKRKQVLERLVRLIYDNGCRLDTGFVSTPFLLDVLCENGYQELAYKLLFQNRCPSWLYEVEHGATTIWENWNAVGADGTTFPTSYNHYAFGCVGDWMYRYLAGISEMSPGYKKIRIAPHVDCGLSQVKASYQSVYGLIQSEWELDGKKVCFRVNVPENTTAQIVLPGAAGCQVTESGEEFRQSLILTQGACGDVTYEIGSGTYEFCYQRDSGIS